MTSLSAGDCMVIGVHLIQKCAKGLWYRATCTTRCGPGHFCQQRWLPHGCEPAHAFDNRYDFM
eukprot:4596655-Prymnesium_polylepis.1